MINVGPHLKVKYTCIYDIQVILQIEHKIYIELKCHDWEIAIEKYNFFNKTNKRKWLNNAFMPSSSSILHYIKTFAIRENLNVSTR